MIPEMIEKEKLTESSWSKIIPQVCNMINSMYNTTIKTTPELVQIGRISNEYFPPERYNRNLAIKYQKIYQNIERSKNRYSKPARGPFKTKVYQPGQPVWLHFKFKVPAEVLYDHGMYLKVKKLSDETRHGEILVPKSLVSLRIPEEEDQNNQQNFLQTGGGNVVVTRQESRSWTPKWKRQREIRITVSA